MIILLSVKKPNKCLFQMLKKKNCITNLLRTARHLLGIVVIIWLTHHCRPTGSVVGFRGVLIIIIIIIIVLLLFPAQDVGGGSSG